MSATSRVLLLTCPSCRERGELPPDLDGVPALECPKCGAHIRLSKNLSRCSGPQTSSHTPSPRTASPGNVAHSPPPIDPPEESKKTHIRRERSSFFADAIIYLKSPDSLRFVAAVIILVGTGLGFYLSGFFSPEGKEPDILERFTNVPIPESVSQEPVIAKSVGGKLLNGAVVVLNQFHHALTPDEKLAWVLRPADVRTSLQQYYDSHPTEPVESLAGFTAPDRVSVEDIRRGIVALVKPRSSEANPTVKELTMIAFFKQTIDGMKLDWESYVQAKDGLLRDFLSDDRSPPSVFRVRLTRAHYFGNGTQPANSICLQLDDLVPLPKQPYLFVPENTDIAKEIKEKLIWSENILNSTRYATVRLAWKPSLASPGTRNLVIDELICWELLGVGSEAAVPTL